MALNNKTHTYPCQDLAWLSQHLVVVSLLRLLPVRVDFSNDILRNHILWPFAWAAIEKCTRAWVAQTPEMCFSFLEARKFLKSGVSSLYGALTFPGEIWTNVCSPPPDRTWTDEFILGDQWVCWVTYRSIGDESRKHLPGAPFQAAWLVGVSYPQQLLLLYITLRSGLLSPVNFRNSVPCKSLLLPGSFRSLSHVLIPPPWLLHISFAHSALIFS